jgi:hypothetical protein
VSARESFAMYLETAGPGEAVVRWRRLLGPLAVEAASARWSGRLLGPHTTPEDVVAALGPPDHRDGTRLGYALPTRSGYFYTFEFDARSGRLSRSGFVRTEAAPVPDAVVSDRSPLPQELADVGATAEEIEAWLGPPASRYGWWPVETWEYAGGPVVRLRHGVVGTA